ncbi:MAG: TIGR02391 family protein [Tepidisphaeraceae bacterium]
MADLHPLVAVAADGPWERQAYGEAVVAAWYALRDVLRDKLDSSADGVRLINLIGESDPRLLLTDFATETDQSMHRGIVSMLRGVASYVRNSIAHDSAGPPGGDDPGRCFEYLAIISLCARHAVSAVQPTTVERIVREASQRRFSGDREAVADLVGALPTAHLPDLVLALVAAYQDAVDAADGPRAERLASVYLHALDDLEDDAPAVRRATRVCASLLADDGTFDVALDLLNLQVFRSLPARHRSNAVHALKGDLRAGRIVRDEVVDGRHRFTLVRVFDGFQARDRNEVRSRLVSKLKGGVTAEAAYAVRVLGPLSRCMHKVEYKTVAAGVVAATMVCHRNDDVFREVSILTITASEEFVVVVEASLREALEHLRIRSSPGSLSRHPAESIRSLLQTENPFA